MINRLSTSNIERLKSLPETGMGYQLVKTDNVAYVDKEIVVLNGQLAISQRALKYKAIIKAITGNNFKKTLQDAKEVDLKIFDVVSPIKSVSSFVSEGNAAEQKPAKGSLVEKANADELFVRLSAFEDDIRVDKTNKCLLPGSFTTTAGDALRCKTENDDPLERYALPNEFVIEWAYYIQPLRNDSLQRGTVEKAFGKRGGGREAFFEKGTSDRTFITQTLWII